jgi:diacylglycerol kinase (ATP)
MSASVIELAIMAAVHVGFAMVAGRTKAHAAFEFEFALAGMTKVLRVFAEHSGALSPNGCLLHGRNRQPFQGASVSYHLIANRFAGKGLAPLRHALAAHDVDITWHLPADLDEASALVAKLRGNCDRLLFAGGDGTFHLASKLLGDGQTPEQEIGLIPTGTGSDFLRSFGSGSDFASRLTTALHGKVEPYRPGQIESAVGLHSFTNVASLGVSAAVAYAIEGGLKKFGAFGYTVAMVQGILTYRSKPMTVHVDGQLVMQGKGYLTAVGCGRYFGGGKMIAPLADPMGDTLHAVAVRDQGVLTTLSATRLLKTGKHIELPIVEHGVGKEIRIEGEGLRSELDGELGPVGNLTIRRGPVAFRLAVPEA